MEVDHNRLYLIVGGENYNAWHSYKNYDVIIKYGGKADCIITVTNYMNSNETWAYASRLVEEEKGTNIYPLTEELFMALTLNFPSLDEQKVIDFEPRRVAVAKFLKEWSKNGSK